jgi:hypothetical protein
MEVAGRDGIITACDERVLREAIDIAVQCFTEYPGRHCRWFDILWLWGRLDGAEEDFGPCCPADELPD